MGHRPCLEQLDPVLGHRRDTTEGDAQGDNRVEGKDTQSAIGTVAQGTEHTQLPLAAEDEGHGRSDHRRRGEKQHGQEEHQDGEAQHPDLSGPEAQAAHTVPVPASLRVAVSIECGAIEARRQGREHRGGPEPAAGHQGHAQIPRNRAMLPKEHHRRPDHGQRKDEPRIPPGRQTEVQRPFETGHPDRPG